MTLARVMQLPPRSQILARLGESGGKQMETGEFEDAGQSSLHNSTSAFVAMIACNVMLLLMLAA